MPAAGRELREGRKDSLLKDFKRRAALAAAGYVALNWMRLDSRDREGQAT